MLLETWKSFGATDLERGDQITPAVVVGLILYDQETFGCLLDETERAQLVALGKVALERYQQKTNPPNKLGKTLAASLKEQI